MKNKLVTGQRPIYRFAWYITLFFSLVIAGTTPAIAKEPLNLDVAKKQVIHYHDSGAYFHDIKRTADQAMRYLQLRLTYPSRQPKKPAIILDIDETSLSNYANMITLDFGGSKEEIRQVEDEANDAAIQPVLKLYNFAKARHVAVFFITGRYEYERKATIDNLQKAGFQHWDGLIMRSEKYTHTPASLYKPAMRKQLVKQGYDIILNMGDQKSDLVGGYADKTFKLPNPFYFIP